MANNRKKNPWEDQVVGQTPPQTAPDTQTQLAQISSMQTTSPVPQVGTTPGGVQITPREINPEVMRLFEDLQAKINRTPVTADEIMRSREYQDLASAIQFQADQAQAANRRDLASRGLLRSTPAVQTMEGTQAYYTAQQQALIPQLIAAEQARRQQEIQNAMSLLSSLSGLYNTAFSQGLQEFQATAPYNLETVGQRTAREQWEREFPMKEAQLTGRYQPTEVARQLAIIENAKRSWFDPNDGTTPEEDNARANAAREALVRMGFSPEEVDRLVGANVTLEQMQANAPALSMPTLQGRQAEQALRMGDLEYQVAANPEYGLAAQAAQQMRLNELNMQDIQARIAQRNAMPAEQRPVVDRRYILDNYGVDPGLTTNYEAFEVAMMQVMDSVNRGRSRADIQEWADTYAFDLRQMGVDPGALVRFASSLIARRSDQQRREQQTSTPGSTSSGRRWYGSVPE